ncbi:MAG TPA: hypothetical protein VFA00_14120 [Actinomycetota bacterium]|nr:hypothetical protein [Actinomycetota bacterium]
MKIAIVALLAVHGLIHAIGLAGTWGWAEFQGASQTPTNIITARPEDPIVRVLGTVWLLALIAFLVAAVLLLGDSAAWRPAALAAVAVSMVPIALWWENAPMGAVANALVVATVILAPKLDGVAA